MNNSCKRSVLRQLFEALLRPQLLLSAPGEWQPNTYGKEKTDSGLVGDSGAGFHSSDVLSDSCDCRCSVVDG